MKGWIWRSTSSSISTLCELSTNDIRRADAKFADESVYILGLIIVIISHVAIMLLCRLLVIKLGPVKLISVLNFESFVEHLLPTITLIAKFGLKTFAISYDIRY